MHVDTAATEVVDSSHNISLDSSLDFCFNATPNLSSRELVTRLITVGGLFFSLMELYLVTSSFVYVCLGDNTVLLLTWIGKIFIPEN